MWVGVEWPGEGGGGGRERYMMLWTEVMPAEHTTLGPLTGLHRAALLGARGASGGGWKQARNTKKHQYTENTELIHTDNTTIA